LRRSIKLVTKVLLTAEGVLIDFEALGQQILERKEESKEEGIPGDAEHAMVGKARGRADTPASASRSLKSRAKNGRARRRLGG
jgi:hypothetical protein